MPTTRFVRPVVAALLAAFGPGAHPESNTMTGNPGFFQPTPDGDPALKVVPPAPQPPAPVANRAPAQTQPRGQAQMQAPAQPALDAPSPAAVADREHLVRQVEPELDRAEREHERAAEKSVQSATTIQGAFTGLTSERDR
jgi:hypothetical protein